MRRLGCGGGVASSELVSTDRWSMHHLNWEIVVKMKSRQMDCKVLLVTHTRAGTCCERNLPSTWPYRGPPEKLSHPGTSSHPSDIRVSNPCNIWATSEVVTGEDDNEEDQYVAAPIWFVRRAALRVYQHDGLSFFESTGTLSARLSAAGKQSCGVTLLVLAAKTKGSHPPRIGGESHQQEATTGTPSKARRAASRRSEGNELS